MWTQTHQKYDVQIVSTQNLLKRLLEENQLAKRTPKPKTQLNHIHFAHFIPRLTPMPRMTYK